MIAIGFVMFVVGGFLLWLYDKYFINSSDWFGFVCLVVWLIGAVLMFAGVVSLMWRFLP